MIKPEQNEKHYVGIGRIVAVLAMIIAVIAARPFLGGFESAFQTVQDYTGFIAPGVVAVFLLGMFFQRTNSVGAFAALIVSVLTDISFVNRIWAIFLLCMVSGIIASRLTPAPGETQLVPLDNINFKTRLSFNMWSIIIALILIALYVMFW